MNFGSPETPELVPADLIRAAEGGLIRAEEFRKNAVKFGWELWEEKAAATIQYQTAVQVELECRHIKLIGFSS